MHSNSLLLFHKHAVQYFRPGAAVLEIGPDAIPSTYQRVCSGRYASWETLDIGERAGVTFHSSDGYMYPLQSERYDIVVSGQVMEHVPKIWIWIKEVARVCKPSGHVITTVPASWPYHEAPVDCWRAFPAGLAALYDEAGLEPAIIAYESLDAPWARRRIPGRSPECQPITLRLAYKLLGRVGFPVECAYDTIAVGRKRE